MKKTKYNFWLDVTIYIVFLLTILTGFILWLVIPHKLDIVFLGISRSLWITTHVCFGLVGFAGVVIHIVWHWGWLKALRGRPLGGLKKKLRANRVVNRIMWIAYIATNVFGGLAWVLHLEVNSYIVRVPDRLHVVFGVMWTILLIVHLVLHWKWITSTTRRYFLVNIRSANDVPAQENI